MPIVWDLDDLTFDGETPLIGGWIGDFDTWTTLAPTDLAGVDLVPNPSDLLDHTTERRRFRKTWCNRQGMDTETCGRLYTAAEPAPDYLAQRRGSWCGERNIAPGDDCTTHFKNLDDEFRAEWDQLWTSRTSALGKLDLSGADLRRADMSGAFLIGVDLTNARMDWATLSDARMEVANLREARMVGSRLNEARMEGANLFRVSMKGAELIAARMEGANFFGSRMEGANLFRARMEGAIFIESRMEGAELNEARMEGANLIASRMEGANLFKARMEGAKLLKARMERADLREARMERADLREARMEGAYLSGARTEGANFHSADLRSEYVTQQMLNNVFGDVKTKIPDGLVMPEHWDDETLEWYEDDPKLEAWLAERNAAKDAD